MDINLIDEVLNTRAKCERIVRFAKQSYKAKSVVLAQFKAGTSDWKSYGETCPAWVVDDMARSVLKNGAYYFSLDLFDQDGFKTRADFSLKMACPFEGYIHENSKGQLIVKGMVITDCTV